MAKIDTAKAIVRAVQSLALATDSASDLVAEYWDAVGTGWIDDDVAPMGITAAQLTACITLLEQVNLLMTNQATTPIMHRTTLNIITQYSDGASVSQVWSVNIAPWGYVYGDNGENLAGAIVTLYQNDAAVVFNGLANPQITDIAEFGKKIIDKILVDFNNLPQKNLSGLKNIIQQIKKVTI